MAPKNNAKGGDKKAAKAKANDTAKDDGAKGKGKGGLKAATAINVRHILVCLLSSIGPSFLGCLVQEARDPFCI